MQPPIRPLPQNAYRPMPPQNRSPWRIIGWTCGGCALLALIVVLLGWFGLTQAMKPTPPPPAYVGAWRYHDDSTSMNIAISPDGHGFRSMHKVKGTNELSKSGSSFAKIDEKNHILQVVETFHIDVAPHLVNGTMEMTLDGVTYKRIGDYQSVFYVD